MVTGSYSCIGSRMEIEYKVRLYSSNSFGWLRYKYNLTVSSLPGSRVEVFRWYNHYSLSMSCLFQQSAMIESGVKHHEPSLMITYNVCEQLDGAVILYSSSTWCSISAFVIPWKQNIRTVYCVHESQHTYAWTLTCRYLASHIELWNNSVIPSN